MKSQKISRGDWVKVRDLEYTRNANLNNKVKKIKKWDGYLLYLEKYPMTPLYKSEVKKLGKLRSYIYEMERKK